MAVPRSHPRRESLLVREKLVRGLERGLVAREGLMAHGRGEAFDYLLGEATGRHARKALRAAAAVLLLAERPIISVNGNVAALCAAEAVRLARAARARMEVNTFYGDGGRRARIAAELERRGARGVLGANPESRGRLAGTSRSRGAADKEGILAADVVVVPLEDGDRTSALKAAGKQVITFDLNPLSRTARTADITIVDNITRGMDELARLCREYSARGAPALSRIVRNFDNGANLAACIREMTAGLRRQWIA
ncbi:uncharacterized protein conserved in archaea [Cenarchaeum symbiosum A]|uniref:4-phosphopantoate--beta-alanine ligase n=1 Tax=Cenarchaeum symbiosum (strain A) TaxID=414004 RepID=A0RXQ6_CENSY|nr:uncharacterized protein conserved in archaea [Cenarchaeum symbiosum A]